MPFNGLACYWACSRSKGGHTALSRTFVWLHLNLVELNSHMHHCTQAFENRMLESAPRTRVREYSSAVSTRAHVLLHAPVDTLDGAQMSRADLNFVPRP